MEALGRVVEKAIGKAKQARVQVSSRSGVQPVLSVESQVPTNRIKEIIDVATQKVMSNTIPDIKGGAAIEIGEGPAMYNMKMLGNHAKTMVGVEIGAGQTGRQGDVTRGFVIRSQLARLPFSDASFNYFIARLATPFQGDLVRAIRELSRIVAAGGQGVLIDYHPFGMYAKRGTNRSRPADSGVARLEDYYRLFRQSGLRVVDVREAFVDESMRQHFKEEEIQAYRNLKGSPLIIFLFVYKPKTTA